ncbi:MAG TPA: hypothetical protein VIN08_25255 [Ohtaekwangia sp.]|uniref:hypothetical protein n=1 Tax=Ohtaekwangia sp. TaxID=2066019 RepID=UPI002F944060
MKSIDFKTSAYFSGTVVILGVGVLISGLLVMMANVVIGTILAVVSLLIFTTHYRLGIDFDKKEYHDYTWILGLKSGDKGSFERIEYIFIKKNKVSQTLNRYTGSSTIRSDVYDGFLKFSEEDKIHLMTRNSKEKLIAKLRPIAAQLQVSIIDYSEGTSKKI